MTNITFSADEGLIEAARERASAKKTSLNAEFRRWLDYYTRGDDQAAKAMNTIKRLRRDVKTEGRKFTREEMNER